MTEDKKQSNTNEQYDQTKPERADLKPQPTEPNGSPRAEKLVTPGRKPLFRI